MAARERVVVAMSGGVDSSLAAALLVEQGYDVVGVSMRLWSGDGVTAESGCCSLDDFLDARRVADLLGIPFYVMDFGDDFRRAVVSDFVREYRAGRTPNPCARCNQFVKFAAFWDRARALGADWIATGHYARRGDGPDGPTLLRGVDADKDQSYFLFGIDRAVLARTLFPVGELRKSETRAEARRRHLPVAGKPDSQEVCFVPRGDYAAFVERYEPGFRPRPGTIVDPAGRVLGHHDGVHRFTIGQRRGLGLKDGGPPRYVQAIEPETGTVRVASGDQVRAGGLEAREANWLAPPPAPGTAVQVKIRSRFAPHEAVVESASPHGFVVRAPQGLRAVTPGQAAVLYDGDRVLGGGWITAARAPRPPVPSPGARLGEAAARAAAPEGR